MLRLLDNINNSWKAILEEEMAKDYFVKLISSLKNDIEDEKTIYPKITDVFKVFQLLEPKDIKVIIIGQDPYHNKDQAMGFSFSVPKGHKIPPSLKNIFKEIKADIPFSIPNHGDLTEWVEDGVFLLNSILTVEAHKPGSHKAYGWQNFTDFIITYLSKNHQHIVFMLWGNFAKKKNVLIDKNKHLVLESPHPSPLARGGFFNNHHFSKAQEYLSQNRQIKVKWAINPIANNEKNIKQN